MPSDFSKGAGEEEPQNGEILPPESTSQNGAGDNALNQTLLAVVSNYTDRPDLLIAELESTTPDLSSV